jgi:hypothetical protein
VSDEEIGVPGPYGITTDQFQDRKSFPGPAETAEGHTDTRACVADAFQIPLRAVVASRRPESLRGPFGLPAFEVCQAGVVVERAEPSLGVGLSGRLHQPERQLLPFATTIRPVVDR